MKIKQKKDKVKEKKILKSKLKSKTIKPQQKQKVAIVAQELKFSRLLAVNEKKTRDKVLKALKKWLNNCFEKGYEFKEDDFVRVWKGLFFAVWMSDKPLIQEELCDSISSILDQFPTTQYRHALLMFRAGLQVLASEWYGIDHHRIDKFLMLVRRFLRASFRCLKRMDWSEKACDQYVEAISGRDGVLSSKTPLYARNALSMLLHICECYIEELSKVSEGIIPEEAIVSLLRPIAALVGQASELRLSVAARRVFTQLLRQSDIVLEFEEKRKAWERMGCPAGGPDALEPVSDDEENPDEELEHEEGSDDEIEADSPLDPRAGHVDVILRPLPVPAVQLASLLKQSLKTARGASHTRVKACMKRFEALAQDINPLPLRDLPSPPPTIPRNSRKEEVQQLRQFEKDICEDPVKNALKSISRRQRKRLLSRARSGIDVTDELNKLTAKTSNGEWQVEEEGHPKTSEKESINKKNKKRKLKKEKLDMSKSTTPPKKIKLTIKGKELKTLNSKTKQSVKTINQSPQSNTQSPNTDVTSKNVKSDVVKPKNYNKQDKVKLVVKQNKLKSTKNLQNSVKKTDSSQKLQNGSPNNTKIASKSDVTPKIKIVDTKNSKICIKDTKLTLTDTKKCIKDTKKCLKTLNMSLPTPKKVKFELKNNSMQKPVDYYKSVRQSPNIPFDGTKKPIKTNLKPNSTPSPINPFIKKKLRLSF